jgi:integrase
MRKPFFWKARNAWFVKDGASQIRLGDTKREAEAAWSKLLRQAQSLESGDPLYAIVADRWLTAQRLRHERGEVSQEWLARVQCEALSFIGGNPEILCSRIDVGVVSAWLHSRPRSLSATTQRSMITTIQQSLNWAVSQKMLSQSPLTGFKKPAAKRRQEYVTADQHAALLDALPGKRNRTFRLLLHAAYGSGCRPGELRKLRWEHIANDYSHAILAEHKTAKKTGKARTIYFSKKVQTILRWMPRRSEFVFFNSLGKPWKKDAIVNRMRRLREKTGLKTVAYSYRHGFATRALVQGVDVATVAELMGHSSTEMVTKHYSHLAEEHLHLRNAAEKMK